MGWNQSICSKMKNQEQKTAFLDLRFVIGATGNRKTAPFVPCSHVPKLANSPFSNNTNQYKSVIKDIEKKAKK